MAITIIGFSLGQILAALSLHFLFALSLGLLGYCLTLTILYLISRIAHTAGRISLMSYRSPLLVGVSLALLSHWILDAFTELA